MLSNTTIQEFQQDLRDRDFRLAIQAGMFDGVSGDIHFGYKTDLDELGDIWLGPTQIYEFPVDAGQALVAVSTDDTDDQLLKMKGIDAATGEHKIEPFLLTGLTPSPISGTWKAITKVLNDDSTPFLGTVSIQGTGVPNANVFSVISPEDQLITQLQAMVPEDKVGFLYDVSVSLNKAGGQTATNVFRWTTRRPGKVWRTGARYGAHNTGSSAILAPLSLPIPVPPGTQIRAIAEPSAILDISAAYALVLVDTDYIRADVIQSYFEEI